MKTFGGGNGPLVSTSLIQLLFLTTKLLSLKFHLLLVGKATVSFKFLGPVVECHQWLVSLHNTTLHNLSPFASTLENTCLDGILAAEHPNFQLTQLTSLLTNCTGSNFTIHLFALDTHSLIKIWVGNFFRKLKFTYDDCIHVLNQVRFNWPSLFWQTCVPKIVCRCGVNTAD